MATLTQSKLPQFDERKIISARTVFFVVILLVALYFASMGPGNGESTLALMVALP